MAFDEKLRGLGSEAESMGLAAEDTGVVVPFERPAKEPELSIEQKRNLKEITDMGYDSRESAYIDLLKMRARQNELVAVSAQNITDSLKDKFGKWFYKTEDAPVDAQDKSQDTTELKQLSSRVDHLGWLIKNSGLVFNEKERDRLQALAFPASEEVSEENSMDKAA